jgi:O-antigen ligase
MYAPQALAPAVGGALPRRGLGALGRPLDVSTFTIYQGAVGVMLLTFVWRVQQIFPILEPLHLTELSALLALGLFLVVGGPTRVLRAISHPASVWICIITLLAVLSVPGGVFPGLSFRFLLQDHLKTLLLLVVLVGAIRSTADARRFLALQVLGGTIYCWAVLTRFHVEAGGRLGGLYYYDSNDLAMLLDCTLPFIVSFLHARLRVTARIALFAAVVLFIVALVKTGSRGGFLGLIAVLAYTLFGSSTVPPRARLLAVGSVLLLLVALSGQGYWKMMSTMLHPTSDYNWSGESESGRMEVWKRGLGYTAERPFLGVGANAFFVAEGKLSPMARAQFYGKGFKWSAPHNSFVQIAAELGVFGLLSFVGLLWSAFATARRLGRLPPGATHERRRDAAQGHALATAILGFAIAGFFLSQAYAAFLYSLLGIIIGLATLGVRREEHAAPARRIS